MRRSCKARRRRRGAIRRAPRREAVLSSALLLATGLWSWSVISRAAGPHPRDGVTTSARRPRAGRAGVKTFYFPLAALGSAPSGSSNPPRQVLEMTARVRRKKCQVERFDPSFPFAYGNARHTGDLPTRAGDAAKPGRNRSSSGASVL
jgi:hypothetical protein